ncbi:MAG: transposase [Chloroflexi bacterium]|nr:transposase [Chloroflexota bacterium]
MSRPGSRRHPRITFHFTPTSASWMNQIETWFGILTRQAIRRGSFGSVKELISMIDTFTVNWNTGSTPFMWTRPPTRSSPRPSARIGRSANRDTSACRSRSRAGSRPAPGTTTRATGTGRPRSSPVTSRC